jgi:hypothetical protein
VLQYFREALPALSSLSSAGRDLLHRLRTECPLCPARSAKATDTLATAFRSNGGAPISGRENDLPAKAREPRAAKGRGRFRKTSPAVGGGADCRLPFVSSMAIGPAQYGSLRCNPGDPSLKRCPVCGLTNGPAFPTCPDCGHQWAGVAPPTAPPPAPTVVKPSINTGKGTCPNCHQANRSESTLKNSTAKTVVAVIGIALCSTIMCFALPLVLIGLVMVLCAAFIPSQVTGYAIRCKDCGYTQLLDHLGRP